MTCVSVQKAGIRIRIRVTPKSSRDGVDGIEQTTEGPALKVRVRAVPEDGAANTAVALVLSDWLGVPKRSVTLTAGGKSRVKTFELAGEPKALEKAVAAKLAAIETKRGG